MEPEPGQDSDHDGASDPQPGQGSPDPAGAGLPGDAASPGSPAASSAPAPAPAPDSDSASSSGASAEADAASAASGASGAGADAGAGDEGESVFGPWDALEGTLGAAREREELLAGFACGGVWDKHAPGPELAAAVARAVGPDWRCAAATGEERIGLLRAMAALQSWSGAGLLGVIRSLIRDDDPPFLRRPRHGDLPDEWDESLVHEIALALAVSAPSAGRTTRSAWELGARLPGVELLLRDGILDLPRAKLIAEVFSELSDENAARAEELLLPELTTPPRKTYTQIERIATAIAAAVDPELAERRRKSAEKHSSRVAMFRESSGTAGLSGRDLPVGETLAAYANLDARAQRYRDSGAFPGERLDRLRATAYLDILNGISAADRIACGHLSSDPAPDSGPADDPDDDGPAGHGGPGGGGPGGGPGDGPGSGGSDCPCDECDGHCAPAGDNDYVDDEPDDDEPDHEPNDGPGDEDLGDDEAPDRGGPDDGGPGERGADDREPNDGQPDDGPGNGSPRGGGLPPAPSGRSGDGPTGGSPSAGGDVGSAPPASRSPFLRPPDGPPPTLTDLVLPLATLLGLAERPGEGHGLGTLDPALCRALAATAALSRYTTLCVTVTNADGIAIGHGCVKIGRLAGPPAGPPPPLVALPARINLTVTTGRLAELRARPQIGPPGPTGPPEPPGRGLPPGSPQTGWALARRGPGPPADPDWCGPWALTLPSGLELALDLEPIPTFDCDHRHESRAYQPNATLRHLVQIRDYSCTFPPCNRHARESDFEHAVPYDQGGRTCACNAGARSRKCHRVKQSPGWNVTQPRPGWHQWTTPRGRTYTQGPKQYPV